MGMILDQFGKPIGGIGRNLFVASTWMNDLALRQLRERSVNLRVRDLRLSLADALDLPTEPTFIHIEVPRRYR